MFRLLSATVGLLLLCSVLTSCDSGSSDAAKYADEMPQKGADPIRVDPRPAPGSGLQTTSSQTGGGG
jgi:hypothetical protein